MLRGFMDHWVPTVDNISTFWKSDISKCREVISDLAQEVAFNNFTFYTKWYTNGIYSELPYLRNHPEASNVVTDNSWGSELISFLHENHISVGAMLQLYTFEKNLWKDTNVLGEWNVSECAATDAPCILADFTDDSYPGKLAQILREQLVLFPDLDYLFLEFEGISIEMAVRAYENHRKKVKMPGNTPTPLSRISSHRREDRLSQNVVRLPVDLPPVKEVTYREEDVAKMEAIGQVADFRCSIQALDMFTYYMNRNLQTAQDVCDELDWHGKLGVVYFPPQYEGLFVPDSLPGNRWRLLPWCYFGWIPDRKNKIATMDMLLRHMNEQLAVGQRVIYIGDSTISPWDTHSIEHTLEFCENNKMEGYLGMGNPVDNVGLRWLNVTDDQVRNARSVFSRKWR